MSESRDVYGRITNKIIADLEHGVRPWMKPWSAEHAGGRITRPLRHNGIPYKGINVVMLWSASVTKGHACPLWLTFKQANELGGHVKKGESAELVVYANRITRTETDAKGEEVEREIPFMKGYTVFNAEQCEDLPAHYIAKAEPPALTRCSGSMQPTGSLPRPAPTSALVARVPITRKAPTMCRCRPSRRSVMPRATPRRWHTCRARRGISLCRSGNHARSPRGSRGLHRHMVGELRDDKRLIFTAAAHTQRAADYLHGLQPTLIEQQERAAA
jgi:antirestriction protein ArdC